MLYFVLFENKKTKKLLSFCFLVTGIILLGLFAVHAAEEQAEGKNIQSTEQQEKEKVAPAAQPKKEATIPQNTILSIDAERTENNLKITIQCAAPPNHNDHKVPGQSGIRIDIANATLQKQVNLLLPEVFNIDLDARILADMEVVRFDFSLPRPYASYTARVEKNNVILLIEDFFKREEKEEDTAEVIPLEDPIDSKLPDVTLTQDLDGIEGSENASSVPGLSQNFGSTGYDDEKLITVDFFKVDLHNVFRMLREVSGVNIIVAEGISGTLTLALNEVPWDFALDIIINLKDLAKEERLNTIVIYPKDNEFKWPEKPVELEIKTEKKPKNSPIQIGGQKMSGEQGAKIIKAKKLVSRGSTAEKKGNLEYALQLYEKALDYWPDSAEKSKLAGKISTIYLVNLQQNSKAVYFAKKALVADKTNSKAALNAAIGHAGMKENLQAQQFFDQSISTTPPSRESLLNYAVFSEQQKQYAAALRLLYKFDNLYGENLNSMVSRARILDKQGQNKDADKVYTAILHAGFPVPPDLKAFIINRIGSNSSM